MQTDSSNTPGAQRLVERLEHRVLLGRPGGFGDFGLAVFSDAGWLWKGDIPYGVTTPIKPSIGLSALSAIPVASARLWRIDLAYAFAPDPGQGRLELRFSNTNKTGFFLPDPNDITDTREKLITYSKAGLLTLSRGSEMPQLNGSQEKETVRGA